MKSNIHQISETTLFGPLDGPMSVSNTLATISSIYVMPSWSDFCQAFFPRSAPAWDPMLQAVVSKHTNLMWSAKFHHWMRLSTAIISARFRFVILVPDNFIVPPPDTGMEDYQHASLTIKQTTFCHPSALLMVNLDQSMLKRLYWHKH